MMPKWQLLKGEAMILRRAGRIEMAIERMLQSIEATKAIPALAERVVVSLNYLADMYLSQNLLADAEAAIREALQRERELPQCWVGKFADNTMILAKVRHRRGDCKEALRLGKEAFAIYKKFIPSNGDYYRGLKQELAAFRTPPATSQPSLGEVA